MRIAKLLLILLLLSIISSAQTLPPANLKATLIISAATNVRGVVLSWDYLQITTVLVDFNIYRKVGPISSTTPFVKIATTNQTKYIDTQVASGATYSYFVTAVFNKIESVPSNQVQITIPSPPIIGFGKISGQLYDDSTRAPIANGNITFIPAAATPVVATNLVFTIKTDYNGNFTARLRSGVYYIYSSARGYSAEFYDNVKTIQKAARVILNANNSLYFSIGLTKGISILVSSRQQEKVLCVNSGSKASLNGDFNSSLDNAAGINDEEAIINRYELYQNYPNPFNPTTTISYQIPAGSFVSLKVYNILGKEVADLVNEQQSAGKYNFNFRANNLPSGVYIYKLTAGSFTSVRKLTLLK